MEYHRLDSYPILREKTPLYVNEPWLIDKSKLTGIVDSYKKEPEEATDNIRIYIPMDLNKEAILRRLQRLIVHYKEVNYKNETEFWLDTQMLISQIEIYDQIWYVRHMPKEASHSLEAVELVEEFVKMLEEISDGGAETFPFETIDELRKEYLSKNKL